MSQNSFQFLVEKEGETRLSAYIQPRAGKSAFAGIFQDRLKIRISAAPVEGEANRECVDFLAKTLGIARSEIRLAKGGQSRQKIFVIARPIAFVRAKLEQAGLGD